MNVKWFKGEEDKDKRKKEVLSFNRAFTELNDLLEFEEHTPDYTISSWSHKQADQNGYNRAMREVKSLLNLK